MLMPASNRVERSRTESRELTRQRLLETGRRSFARKGLAGTNLKDDILVPAAVSVGSFYHQFHDKTDLFLAILEAHSQTFRAMIREAHRPSNGQSPADVARHSIETVFRVAEENGDLFLIMFRERESENPRVGAYLRDNRRRWIDSLAEDYRRIGVIADAGTAALAAELISALTAGTVLNYLEYPRAERLRRRAPLIDALVRFIIGGIPALGANAVKARSRGRDRRKGAH
jgi:AcrR family transcriptional regulator